MKQRNAELSKKKILEVSTRVFAESGFDGARVDEIAAKADVNKALIYYYFKSKKNILNIIIDSFLAEGVSVIMEMEASINNVQGEDFNMHHNINLLFDYLEHKREILVIILMESLKKGGDNPFIKIIKEYSSVKVEEIVKAMKAKGMSFHEDRIIWIISELFTGLIPSMMFSIFSGNLEEYFNINKKELRAKFITVMGMTHLQSHKE